MKKMIALALALLLSLTGCGEPSMRQPGNFYYRAAQTQFDSADGVIRSEQRELADLSDSITSILELYLQGPQDPDLVSPFPRNTHVVQAWVVDDALILTLSEEFAQLSGVDLTIACGCITKTASELMEVQKVRIQVPGRLLSDQRFFTMSADSLQLEDDSLERLATTMTVYYADADRRYLVGKELSINLADQIDIADYLISQLTTPPRDSDLLSPLPEGTRLLDASIENRVCKVDFSAEFDQNLWRSSEAQRLSLLSVVNTLTQLPQVDYVQFYSEGSLLTQYRLLTIAGPMAYDERAIGPVRSGVNEFDASLYLANGSNEYLVCVPTRIRQSANMTQAELVVQELIAYPALNGFSSPVPKDTGINSVNVEEGVCYVDLDERFLNTPSQVPQALRSLVCSICVLDEIEHTVVTVNGSVPTGELAPFFQITAPESGWLM